MDCIAHRGFAEVNAENTLGAIRAAAAAGADRVEVDVRRCGSGELVVVHDETLERVAGVDRAVADTPLDRLREVDVLGSGAGVPTLAAVLDAGVLLNVELKERGLADDALAAADAAGREPLFSAFDPAVVEAVAERGGAVAPLFAEAPEETLALARRLDCPAVHPHHGCCDEAFVADAHAASLRVNAWTVRSRETAAALADAGVDGLIADAPAYCRP